MKLIQEQVNKLREGKIALMVDRHNIQTMDIIVNEAFPKGDKNFIDYLNRYSFVTGISKTLNGGDWNDYQESYSHLKLIPLADFFEEEEKESKSTFNINITVPKTANERDARVKELSFELSMLKAMEFKKELPSELSLSTIDLSSDEETLIKLLRMRDVYRDGWVSDTISTIDNYCIEFCENKLNIDRYRNCSSSLSFQDEKTAELFLSNFKEYLEQVKHLIS